MIPVSGRIAILLGLWLVLGVFAAVFWPGPDPAFRFEVAIGGSALALTLLINSLSESAIPGRELAFEIGRKAAFVAYAVVALSLSGLAASEISSRLLVVLQSVNVLAFFAFWVIGRVASRSVASNEHERGAYRSGIERVRLIVDLLAAEVTRVPASCQARCGQLVAQIRDHVRFAGSRSGRDTTKFDEDLVAVIQGTLSRVSNASGQQDQWFIEEFSACEAFVRANVAERESVLRQPA